MSYWIKVSDPPKPEQAVALRDGKDAWFGAYSYCEDAEGLVWTKIYGEICWTGKLWYGEFEWDDWYEPTHWHALPDPLEIDDQRASSDAEIERLREKNLNLYTGFQDCLSYYYPDNLTMQSNEREWQKILHTNQREPRGL